MAGPRKPMHLHLVQGTNRTGRHAPAAEPPAKPVEVAPAPPAHMKPEAAGCWRRLAPMLAGMSVLTESDLLAFERLCATYQEVCDADMALEMLGATTYETTSITGGFMRRSHPEVAQRADAERRLLALMGQFGLTPSARARLAVPGTDRATDKLNKYFS